MSAETPPAKDLPATFLDAEKIIAASIPGYRPRPQQQKLAAEIERILATALGEDGTPVGHLMAEAGTGTGKSLAALIPATLTGGLRVVVSTTTLALMNQYATKDLPMLEEKLGEAGVTVSWATLKGLSNFLCRQKLSLRPEKIDSDILKSIAGELGLAAPDDTAETDHIGDRDSLTTPLKRELWGELSSTSDECPGKKKCAFGSVCFGMRHRAKAMDADIVVTNAAVLLTDVKVNKEIRERSEDGTTNVHPILGPYDALIVDEAHELGDIATDHLGHTIKQGGLLHYASQAITFLNLQSLHREDDDEGSSLRKTLEIQAQEDKIGGAVNRLGEIIAEAMEELDSRETKLVLDAAFMTEDRMEVFLALHDALFSIVDSVNSTKVEPDNTKQKDTRERLTKTGESLLNALAETIRADENETVRWAETSEVKVGGRETTRWMVKTAPINVAPILREELWDQVPAVLMSATFSTGTGADKFGYMQRTLGLEGCQTLDVGSPFDYRNQALLYVPPNSTPPPAGNDYHAWSAWFPEATMELIRASGGGAMLLFSSRKNLNEAHDALADRLRADGLQVLKQYGDLTTKEIAEKFREDENSVLFGSRSFMTGMDFAGRTCRLVIIDKLPFPVPSEPIFAARSRAIKARGGSDFYGLSVPIMTLILHQAFGRLIRSVDDWGTVAILDPRLVTKSYGKRILGALPGSPYTTDLADVRTFYSAWNNLPNAA